MTARRLRRRTQAGFTIIELMVSLVLFSLIITGILSVATTMATGYRDQEVTVSAEGATRSVIDFMADGIRGAGPGVAGATSIGDLDDTACPVGPFAITNAVAAVAPMLNTTDSLTVVMPWGSVVTSTRTAYPGGGSAVIQVQDASQLNAGDLVMFTDFNTGHIVALSAVDKVSSPNTITTFAANCGTPNPAVPTGGYAVGSTVVRVMRAKFFIAAQDGVPVLMMDPDGGSTPSRFAAEPIAEGIEDLQVVVGNDDNGDGALGAENSPAAATDEWHGNNSGDTILTNPTAPRAIRITLVARTTKAFTGINTYKLQAIEDRAANGATDDFRRRILSTTIEVRNQTGSP